MSDPPIKKEPNLTPKSKKIDHLPIKKEPSTTPTMVSPSRITTWTEEHRCFAITYNRRHPTRDLVKKFNDRFSTAVDKQRLKTLIGSNMHKEETLLEAAKAYSWWEPAPAPDDGDEVGWKKYEKIGRQRVAKIRSEKKKVDWRNHKGEEGKETQVPIVDGESSPISPIPKADPDSEDETAISPEPGIKAEPPSDDEVEEPPYPLLQSRFSSPLPYRPKPSRN